LSVYRQNARTYARQYLSKETILQQFEVELLKACGETKQRAEPVL